MGSELPGTEQALLLGEAAANQGLGSTREALREVDGADARSQGCIWLTEKAAPDWTPLSQAPGPLWPTPSLAPVPTAAG